MRIAITGAGGLLGSDLFPALAARCHHLLPLRHADCDVTRPAAIARMLRRFRPDLIINCAAFTRVDECESRVAEAYRVNAEAPGHLADACHRAGCGLLHLSTDYVFPGTAGRSYREHDPPRPLSVYGASKWAGEAAVRKLCPRHYIVRTQWLFGRHGPTFVRRLLELAKAGSPLRVVADQTGSPTYTRDLAAALCTLIEGAPWGTYHLTNSGHCSWWQFAREILYLAGRPEVQVAPIASAELARPAARPPCSVLANCQWLELGLPPLRPYRTALADFLNEEEGGVARDLDHPAVPALRGRA